MSSGFRHWIWYAMHSNSSFSGGGSREREWAKLDKSKNEEGSLTRFDRWIYELTISFPLYPNPSRVFPIPWVALVDLVQGSEAQPARGLRDILA
jgi:hypothetical protein